MLLVIRVWRNLKYRTISVTNLDAKMLLIVLVNWLKPVEVSRTIRFFLCKWGSDQLLQLWVVFATTKIQTTWLSSFVSDTKKAFEFDWIYWSHLFHANNALHTLSHLEILWSSLLPFIDDSFLCFMILVNLLWSWVPWKNSKIQF